MEARLARTVDFDSIGLIELFASRKARKAPVFMVALCNRADHYIFAL